MSIDRLRLVFDGPGVVSLKPVEQRLSPSPYTLIAKTTTSIINAGTESAILNGAAASLRSHFPCQPSAACVGEIVELGRAVSAACPQLRLHQRVFITAYHQSFAQCDALQDEIYVIAGHFSDEQVLLARQALVGIHALSLAPITLGTSVLVVGLGVIGQLTARLAALAGARPVLATDSNEHRIEVANRAPYVAAVNAKETPKNAFECVILASPAESALHDALQALVDGGTLVIACATGGEEQIRLSIANQLFRRNIRVISAHEMALLRRVQQKGQRWVDLLRLPLGLIEDGSLDLDGLISHRITPAEAVDVYARLTLHQTDHLGVTINWSK